MKLVIQKETGIGETCVVEIDGKSADFDLETQAQQAFQVLDARIAATNQKIVEVRDFMAQIKDANYRYLFVTFFDQMLGVSSQAEPLARKFKVDPPMGFDEWLAKNERIAKVVPK